MNDPDFWEKCSQMALIHDLESSRIELISELVNEYEKTLLSMHLLELKEEYEDTIGPIKRSNDEQVSSDDSKEWSTNTTSDY